ncbi:MAG TPA: hypothetical protein VMF06_22785 [Candidatus Limnocylindria bacterium]|jgi:hypothetical protein|nr:hypothetical protein [Candidatus Limnocylindria bacterium]
MRELTDPRWIHLKGFGFLILGLFAAACIFLEHPEWKLMGLVAICVWAFARFYYFAFYVIQNYTDPSYRYSGLGSFVKYWVGRRRL